MVTKATSKNYHIKRACERLKEAHPHWGNRLVCGRIPDTNVYEIVVLDPESASTLAFIFESEAEYAMSWDRRSYSEMLYVRDYAIAGCGLEASRFAKSARAVARQLRG